MISIIEKKENHFSDLDGMRGVLSCAVMLMHFGMDRITSIVSGGYIGRSEWGLSVDFFFILSGFVISKSILKSPTTLLSYIEKRFFRLAPMYFIALIAVIVAGKSGYFQVLTLNILMIQSIFSVQSLNYPSWSIPFEMYIPATGLLLVPIFNRISNKYKNIILFGLIVGGSITAYFFVTGIESAHARALFGLFTGMALFISQRDNIYYRDVSNYILPLLFVVSILVMIFSVKIPVLAVGFYPIVILCIMFGSISQGVFSWVIFKYLGRWSYSIYLLHVPVLIISQNIIGRDIVGHNPPLKLALAVITIVLAAGTYNMIERPFITIGTRRALSRRLFPIS